jgi:hypothetical protein
VLSGVRCLAAEAPQKPAVDAPSPKTFRVAFTSYNGDLDKPATIEFLVNLKDYRVLFCLPHLGDFIPNTKVKLHAFKHRTQKSPDGTEVDVSELTFLNTETQASATVVLGETADIAAVVRTSSRAESDKK